MHTSSHWYKTASCRLVDWEDGRVTLSSLHSEERNQGHATVLMQQMVDYFDNQNLTALLDAKPYGKRKDGLSTAQLITFYEKFGFKTVDNVKMVLMERVPSQ